MRNRFLLVWILLLTLLAASACERDQIGQPDQTKEEAPEPILAYTHLPDDFFEAAEGETLRERVLARFRKLEDIRYFLPEEAKIEPQAGDRSLLPAFFKLSSLNAYQTGTHWPMRGLMCRADSNTTVTDFLYALDENGLYTGPTNEDYLGINSLTAVSYAWSEIDCDFVAKKAEDLLPSDTNRIEKVGGYELFDASSSTEITAKNGKDTMLEAYKQLKAGDILLTYNENGAYALLVEQIHNDTVFYFTYYPTCLHQIDAPTTNEDLSVYTGVDLFQHSRSDGGRLPYSATFDELYDAHFIPLTHEALEK